MLAIIALKVLAQIDFQVLVWMDLLSFMSITDFKLNGFYTQACP